tara:strand:- start:38 stop:664 length:627 start_codon:yes stop_codon:yes gene_type:complete
MSDEEEEATEEEASEEDSSEEGPSEKDKKFDLEKIKEQLKSIDWRDKKVMGIVGAVVLLLVVLILFSGGEEPAEKKEASKVDWEDLQRPVDYVMVFGKDPKDTELRATIKDEDRVMQFSMSLGIEQKALRLEIFKRMAPITSEILRHFSRMTKEDILDMIHEEEGKIRQKLLVGINTVLQNAGEERLDLRKSGRIVSISFTKFYFPSI